MSVVIKNDHLDLYEIARSGQCFRWREGSDGEWIIPAFGRVLKAVQTGKEVSFSCDEKEWETVWKDYLDIDRDYGKIESAVLSSGDRHLKECLDTGHGIRILKQDLWETVVSFMISQNNNIPRIKGSIEKLCALAGKKIRPLFV